MLKYGRISIAALISLIIVFSACTRYQDKIQTQVIPEDELYLLAMQKFDQGSWSQAIATFDRFERLWVNSDKIQEVRLKRADAQFNRKSAASLIMAKGEYQSFLTLYPNYESEDYIWLQICKCSFANMLPPNREQGPTKEAIKDLEAFMERFSDSEYLGEARELLQAALKNLADYHLLVAYHYYNRKIYNSAAERFKEALKQKVEITNLKQVLYDLTFALAKSSDYFGTFYKYVNATKQKSLSETYLIKHQSYLYEAKQYLAEMKDKFPEASAEISELQNQINMVTPIKPAETEDNQ